MILVSLTVTCSNTETIPVYHSAEPEISVVLIGVSVAQSLVVYVAITTCPLAAPEISVVLIGVSVALRTTEICGASKGQAVIATYKTKD
jgi:hypothetical protein